MRKIKALLICLALTLAIFFRMVNVSVSSPGTTIYMDPPNVTAWPLNTPGGHGYNTFLIEVKVSEINDLYGWSVWISWDPSMVSLTNYYEGPFIKGPFTYNTSPKIDVENITVSNPTLAYDGDSNTYASFTYAQTSAGNYTMSSPTIPLKDYPIDKVDLKMRYSVEAASDDTYRIVYYSSTDLPDKRTLVDWTSAGQSLGTYTWPDVNEPNDGAWDWIDVSNLEFMIETQQNSGSPDGKIFRIYEMWIEVQYRRDMFHPDPVINYAAGNIFDGTSATGDVGGASGSGTIAKYKFVALTSGSSLIEFDSPIPTQPEIKLLDPDGGLISHTSADSSFTAPPWDEDINADGIVDIFDIVMVAIGFGKTSGSPDWDRYKDGDINGDLVIDIEDLVAVALKWGLSSYL